MDLKLVPSVGEKTEKLLNNLSIYNIYDLVEYYPYSYNFVVFKSLDEVSLENGFLKCTILTEAKVYYIKRNLNKLSFIAKYNNKEFNVIIFNRNFLKNNLTINKEIILYGKYDKLRNTFVASDIKFNLVNNSIVPIYHLTKGVKQNKLRSYINSVLNMNIDYKDYIPDYYNEKYNYLDKYTALKYIHNPESVDDIKKAKLKLIYEEFFKFMFKINYLKIKEKGKVGIKRNISDKKLDEFFNLIPFELTKDQLKTTLSIKEDMMGNSRMNRLVLGDVGSGKTMVAMYAMYLNYLANYQSAFLVPTEILAMQHFKNVTKLFKDTSLKVDILLGKMSKKEKTNIYKRLLSGDIDLIIGTHSLLNEDLEFKNLGLVITDEQHRFGVLQRKSLEEKGLMPDVLYLSATPIPRTYALTIYGDMDISLIKTKPNGRLDIITKVYKEKDIKEVLGKTYAELENGNQVFVVSPLIENEESELNSVIKLKSKLESAFSNKKIEIIHGRLKQEVKDAIMNEFLNKKIDILISTTVIEVGIDIENATVMIIYNAERFGLATLHQLRGRVGRSDKQSYCFLISDKDNKRLSVMEESNDGFYITEKDFELRGEGDLFGVRQSGDMVFKIANIKKDIKILMQAKIDSEEYINSKKYLDNQDYLDIVNELTFLN